MVIGIPDYVQFIYMLGAVYSAAIMYPRNPVAPLLLPACLWLLYASNANHGALLLAFVSSFILGLIDAVRDRA